jgi:hypothetical protein
MGWGNGTGIVRPEAPNPGEGRGRVQSQRGVFATQGVTWAGISLSVVSGPILMRLGISRGGCPSSRTALIREIPGELAPSLGAGHTS